jgi:hypothetical protein
MPTVTLRFTLPDEQGEYDAARLGSEAMQTLWQIEQHCRERLNYGDAAGRERAALEAIREMIPHELLEH